MKKVLVIFGTRPEAIKMCPLVLELKKSEKLETLVCVTGQHREMLKQVLDIFKVVPDYDMAIMKKGQDLTDVTTAILTGMREILRKEKPDIVLFLLRYPQTSALRNLPVDRSENASDLRSHPPYSDNGDPRFSVYISE